MKKFILVFVIFAMLLFAGSAFAASNMDDVRLILNAPNMQIIKVRAVSHTDGSYTASTVLSDSQIGEYWSAGWRIGDVYAVNGAAGYPNTAGTVTITDASGRQLVGATATDTLTLSTSESGIAYLTIERVSSQRSVSSKLYLTVGDTQSGTATTAIDIYIVLVK